MSAGNRWPPPVREGEEGSGPQGLSGRGSGRGRRGQDLRACLVGGQGGGGGVRTSGPV